MVRPVCLMAFSGWAVAAIWLVAVAGAQGPPGGHSPPDEDRSGPAGRMKRSQIEELLKADRAKSIEDAAQLVKLSEELKAEIEKTDKSVLSVTAIRKAEEIEKIAKRIRGRLRRF